MTISCHKKRDYYAEISYIQNTPIGLLFSHPKYVTYTTPNLEVLNVVFLRLE